MHVTYSAGISFKLGHLGYRSVPIGGHPFPDTGTRLRPDYFDVLKYVMFHNSAKHFSRSRLQQSSKLKIVEAKEFGSANLFLF